MRPSEVSSTEIEDDMYRGQRALRLAFSLPRGCYATILVKRITSAAGIVHAGSLEDADGTEYPA